MKSKKVVNPDIRERIARVGYGEVSDTIGVSESTLYRCLRHELTVEQRQFITSALEQLEVG